MSVSAMGIARKPAPKSAVAPRIFLRSDYFQMPRIETFTVAAQMVDL